MTSSACKPIVMSGPSGGGKSTILTRAMREHPGAFAFSVSHTTRKPRDGEVDGQHYHFVDKERMQGMLDNGEFLENAVFGGNMYGTSRAEVEKIAQSGRIPVLDVDLQGVRLLKKAGLSAKYVFIRAPSLETLEARLRARGTETDESLQKRLRHAREDVQAVDAEPSLFDVVIVNDQLEPAYEQFLNVIKPELDAVKH